jgi:hypothetical protein
MTRFGVVVLLLGAPRLAMAQVPDVRAELQARGAPPSFVDQVGAIVDAARADGLPAEPMVDKAIEGWAKHDRVPLARVVQVLEQVRARLREGRTAAREAGMASPLGAVVAAAGEALGRGMTAADVRQLIGSAPAPATAAAGLTVAAALAAQGLERGAAVRAVRDAYAAGGPPERLYELPSVVADMRGHGMAMTDVAKRIMEGGGLPLPPMAGQGQGQGMGRPGNVPPEPGQRGTRGNNKQ